MVKGLMDGSSPTPPQRGMTSAGSGAEAVQRQQQMVQNRAYAQAVAQQEQADAEWKASHVEVAGGWVEKAAYDAMTLEQQRMVVALGVEGYNRRNKANALRAQAEFEQANIKIGEDYIPRIAYEAMEAEDKSHLNKVGLAQYQQDVATQQTTLATLMTKLSNYASPDGGHYVTQALADKAVTTDELVASGFLKAADVDAAQKEANDIATRQAITARLAAGGYKDPSGEGYYTIDALAAGAVTADELVQAGYITEDQKAQAISDAEKTARIAAAFPKIESYKTTVGDHEEYDLVGIFRDIPISPGDIVLIFGPQPGDTEEVKREKHLAMEAAIKQASVEAKAQVEAKYASPSYKRAKKAASIAKVYLDFTVPGYGTQRHWSEMGKGGKLFGFAGPQVSGGVLQAVSIGTDFLMVLPILGAAGKAARGATLAKVGLGEARAARLGRVFEETVGIGTKIEKPAGMSEEAFQALKKLPLRSRLSETHLTTGELWKQVAWPATLLESGGKVIGKASTLAKRNLYGSEIKGRLIGDVFDPDTGNILKAAEGGKHEVVGGTIARRVRVMVVDEHGKILLGSDRTEPKGYYHIPGGHIPNPDMTPARYKAFLGKLKKTRGISLEDAARIQLENEFGLKLKKMNRLPNYLGRINRHSLNGMYVFEAESDGVVNTLKHLQKNKPPEIKDFKWWNGKTKIEVGPATKEMLDAYNEANHMGWNMSKVKIHPLTPEELLLNNALDAGWAERLGRMDVYGTSSPLTMVTGMGKGGVAGAARETGEYTRSAYGRVKAMLGSLENIVDPWKIPESSVSDAGHTIKIRLSEFENPQTALAARAKLVKAVGKSGDSLIVETPDAIMVWRRSRLMREMGGGMAHATPQGDEFIAGLVVKWKSGMPAKEQGLFWSPEPLFGFAEQAAHGGLGERPTIYVATQEWIDQNTEILDKIYNKKIEAETKSLVGTHVPKPKQVLHTRLGHTGQRVDIMLQKPLTWKQIVKLKALGIVEQAQNIYSPVIYLEPKMGKPLSAPQAEAVAKMLDDMGEDVAARVYRTVADDPSGALRVLKSFDTPTVYRMRVSGTSAGAPRLTMERVAARAGRDDPIGRAIRQEDAINRAFITRQTARAVETPRRAVTGRTKPPARTPPVGRITPTPRVPGVSRVPGISRIPGVSRTPEISRVSTQKVPTTQKTAYPWLPDSLSKAQVKKSVEGTVAFAMGELSGKTAYWILYPPKYGIDAGPGVGEGKAFSLDKPEGVTIAADMMSAYKTIQAKGGVVPADILGSIGFAPYAISGGGKAIKFSKPKKVKPRLSR